MATYFYCRVSTQDKQTFDRQEQVFKEHNFLDIPQENIFQEKISGTKGMDEREEMERMISILQEGDIVVFESLSRVGRSLQVIFDIIDLLVKQKKVEVRVLKENLTLSNDTKKNAMSNFMLNIFASIAQLERDLISERVSEALQAKKENGVVLGRPNKITQEKLKELKNMYAEGYKYEDIAKYFGVTRHTIMNTIKENNLPLRNKRKK